jgi:hypothetical protein
VAGRVTAYRAGPTSAASNVTLRVLGSQVIENVGDLVLFAGE